ncbi:MAG: RHS repeat-associated core domain-containing protein, partial [Myxococcaceae bacterium]
IFAFTQGSSTYFPLTDALGSVYAVSTSSGQVTRSFGYDVYGERSNVSGASPELAFGFTGREHDASGLNYNRDRYLDVRVGRWHQPDRLGFVDGLNVFAYVGNEPAKFTDAFGQVRDSPTALLFAAIASRNVAQIAYALEVFGLGETSALALATTIVVGANAGGSCIDWATKNLRPLQSVARALGQRAEILRVTTRGPQFASRYIGWEVTPGNAASTVQVSNNALHYSVRVGGQVFDNLSRNGVPYAEWEARLITHPTVTKVIEVVEELPTP